MSMGSTTRYAQTAGDLGFTVQFNAETPWNSRSSAIQGSDVVVVVNHCFTSLFGTKGLLRDIVKQKNLVVN